MNRMNVAPSVRDRNEIWPMYSKFSLRSYCAPEARDVPEQQEGLKESDLCSKAGAVDGGHDETPDLTKVAYTFGR